MIIAKKYFKDKFEFSQSKLISQQKYLLIKDINKISINYNN